MIEGRRWQPEERCWSVPYSEGIIERVQEVFEGEEVHIDPSVKICVAASSLRENPALEKPPSVFPALVKGGKGGFSCKEKAPFPPELKLEDLRRELVTTEVPP